MKFLKGFAVIVFFLLVLILVGSCSDTEEGPVTEPDEIQDDVAEEAKTYDGAFKFTGEAVMGVEGTDILIDLSVSDDEERGNYTDIVMTEGMIDFEENVFKPGTYEFQFVEFPEETGKGSWYIYINDDIKISGNPNASDAGKEYELKEGDTISVEFWTIATFYKVAE